MIILHAVISIALIVLLIIKVKVDPIIALMVGSLYMGIAGGLGLVKTVTTIADGFGNIMVDVGLLIGFGVLIGSLLNSMGALEKPFNSCSASQDLNACPTSWRSPSTSSSPRFTPTCS